MSPDKKQDTRRPMALRAPHLLIAAAIILVAALILLRRSPAVANSPVVDSSTAASEEFRKSAHNATLSQSSVAAEESAESSAAQPTPAPALTPDPAEPQENARIGYHIDNFRAYSTQLDDFKLDNAQLVNDGIILANETSGETTETAFRRGVLESPTIQVAHPSNAFQPIWRATLPNENTAIQIELAKSADAQNWSEWFTIQPSGDDISPTYPDGRPNPNYGAVSGTIVSDGLRLYPFIRYRVTLTSTGEDVSPILEEFKVTYLDSTEGEGYLAGQGPQPSSEVAPSEASHPLIGTPVPSTEQNSDSLPLPEANQPATPAEAPQPN